MPDATATFWAWRHERVPGLLAADFGHWDGLAWSLVPREEIDAWCGTFVYHRHRGGETLHDLCVRVAGWRPPAAPVTIIAHACWMLPAAVALPTSPDRERGAA
jgi:alpha-ribazole phosphatase